ncbi:MAG: hypothetical protein M1359_10930 [Betaproteobacteria bacterium]|jgi:hypothetical protein|nr:hypothetical protein [Betaproteobacteria bacterium]
MSTCDDYCNNYGCNRGPNCPARAAGSLLSAAAPAPAVEPSPLPELWEFSDEEPTFLQVDMPEPGKPARWYLKKGFDGPEPAYAIELKPDIERLTEVFVLMLHKRWTDKVQLLEALTPAIFAVEMRRKAEACGLGSRSAPAAKRA